MALGEAAGEPTGEATGDPSGELDFWEPWSAGLGGSVGSLSSIESRLVEPLPALPPSSALRKDWSSFPFDSSV